MQQRLKKAINSEDEEKFRQADCREACSIGVANSEILIPAFKRTVEQKRKVTQVLEFLKEFEISEKDIFDYRGERFCYLFNLKVAVTRQGVGRRLLASIKTAVEYEILNWEYNSLFPEKQVPPQIVHYLASVGPKMPADGFYVKQGFSMQDNDVEPWAHQDGLKLYHLERQPNQMSLRSVFKFDKNAANIIDKMYTKEEEKQESDDRIQIPEQLQNTPMIKNVQSAKQQHVIGVKLGASCITTGGSKKKHCKECNKPIAAQHWAAHVYSVHQNGDPGFERCLGDSNCVFCKDTPLKRKTNKNRYYTCPECPSAKKVRSDTIKKMGGKCAKCGTMQVHVQSKGVLGVSKTSSPIEPDDSVSMIGKRPTPTTLDVLEFDILNNTQFTEDYVKHISDNDTIAQQDGALKVNQYLAKQDKFQQSLVAPPLQQEQQFTLSGITDSMSRQIQIDTKPISTAGNVVNRLQKIEKSVGTSFASLNAAYDVQAICVSFFDELVCSYMEQPVTHEMLREAVKEVQQRTLKLTTEQAAGILFASFILGGDCLPGAIKSMLTLRLNHQFENVFSLFMAAISTRYGQVLGKWIGLHWEFMNSTHLKVMSTMSQILAEGDVNLLTLFITVNISSSEELQILIHLNSRLNGTQEYERLLDAIEQNPRQAGITQQYFFELIGILQDNQFYSTIEHLGDGLLLINLSEWATTIIDTHQQLSIINVASAQQFI